jgi:hypothetical protein
MRDFVGLEKGMDMFLLMVEDAFQEYDLIELWNGGELLCYMLSPKATQEGVQQRFADLLFAA